MRQSTDRIPTGHAAAQPDPQDLLDGPAAKETDEAIDRSTLTPEPFW